MPSAGLFAAEPPQLEATHGLGGAWKLGVPSPLWISVESIEPFAGRIEVQSIDGDGVPVVYRSESLAVQLGEKEKVRLYASIPCGRASSRLVIRLLDSEEHLVRSLIVGQAKNAQVLPATQPWIVSLGGDLRMEEMGYRAIAGTLPSYSTTVIENADDLPVEAIGYTGVNIVAISTLNADWLNRLSNDQQVAISQWVSRGGCLFVSVGANANAVKQAEWLSRLLPGEILGRLDGVDPGPLESFAGSEKPLAKLTCVRIDPRNALVDLAGLTRSRETFPLIARGVHGLGQIVMIGFDLDSDSFLEWPDRGPLLGKLIYERLPRIRDRKPTNETMSSVGYSDLSGQLRGTLDVFPGVKTVEISFLAGLLIAFLLVVGPLDYYLWVRQFKLSQITWWTLALASLTSCIGIGWLARQWKPAEARLNEVTVWDIDQANRQMKGRSWLHLYSGARSTYDFEGTLKPFGSAEANPGIMRVDWMGIPGAGLGGFESSVTTNRGMPEYAIELMASRAGGPMEGSRIRKVGIPVAGSKTFQAQWDAPWSLVDEEVSLGLVRGTDLLQGKWSNPLNVDLREAVAMYKNWAYVLPTRLPPGQVIDFTTIASPKDLARRLQKRRIFEGNEQGSPWEPGSRTEIDRLMDMVLFYRAAGGEGYTTLTHQVFGEVDLSELLRMDRAMIVGRIDGPTWDLRTQRDGSEQEVQDGMRKTWVRFIVPIRIKKD